MLLRNGLILVILAPQIALSAALPPAIAVAVSLALAFAWRDHDQPSGQKIELSSPFSVAQVLRFGLIFLAITVAGDLGQRWLGSAGLYAVSFLGGLVSSASATATVATLASQGKLGVPEATAGVLLASSASLLIHPVLVARLAPRGRIGARVWAATGGGVAAALAGLALLQVIK
jgi:uncharacterized membrane protein (DUF4010 family)